MTTITKNGLHDWWFETKGLRYHFGSEAEAQLAQSRKETEWMMVSISGQGMRPRRVVR